MKNFQTAKYLGLFLLLVLAFGLFSTLPPHKVFAASTYTVNSIGDDPDDNPGDSTCETATPGECTLRAAIQEVNAGSGGDTINFGISGSGVHTLTPAACYDDITESVTINGYSQTGSAVNTAVAPAALNGTLTIEIDGTGAASLFCPAFNIASDNVTIKGLVINHDFTEMIKEDNAHSNINITGNYLGTSPDGLSTYSGQGTGVRIKGCTNCNVGTTAAADRNVISVSQGGGRGIYITDTTSNVIVRGNYVGVGADGTTALGNKNGSVDISDGNASGITIGGSASGSINILSACSNGAAVAVAGSGHTIEGNYMGLDRTGVNTIDMSCGGGIIGADISDSTFKNNVIAGMPASGGFGGGIFLYGVNGLSGNKFQGNKIGTDKDGNAISGSGNGIGITLAINASNNLIGGTGAGEGNTIAYNTGIGVNIMDFVGSGLPSPVNNTIIGNSIHDNSELGIDLTGMDTPFSPNINVGVTPNDSGDPDESSNHYMNFPVINSATKGSGEVTVNYNLDINSAESGATGYNVAFYASTAADPSGYGEGEIYLGSDTVAGDVTGKSKTLSLPGSVPSDYYITAVTTMTDASSDGFGHSSEFSAAIAATTATPGGGGSGGSGSSSNSSSGTSSDGLSDTGDNTRLIAMFALLLLGTGLVATGLVFKKHESI